MTLGSVMEAMMRMACPQRGQTSGSTSAPSTGFVGGAQHRQARRPWRHPERSRASRRRRESSFAEMERLRLPPSPAM